MNIPQIAEIAKYQVPQNIFRGYNHNLVIDDTEFYDMKNITGDYYPVLSPRKKRGYIKKLNKCHGLGASVVPFWVEENDVGQDILVYNNAIRKELPLNNHFERQFVIMGAQILIFPDKVIFNTSENSNGDFEYIEAEWKPTSTISYYISTLTGDEISPIESDEVPVSTEENPIENGTYWMDKTGTEPVLRVYDAQQDLWSSIATTYVKIKAKGIADDFGVYDAVQIEGLDKAELNGSFIIWDVNKDEEWILVTALISSYEPQTEIDDVSITRKMPDFDYITESENRLWCCRWDNKVNEVYACAQGDPKNWNKFMGTSQDSYYLTLGSDGPFTGIAVQGGYVLFFKENIIHKLYGSKPSNYQITNVTARGVAEGSSKSAVVLNETLYYLCKNGVCQYLGSSPDGIYQNFGGIRYKDAVAGQVSDKYYISMRDKNNVWHLFTWDERLQMWHKEDNLHVKYFAENKGVLYYVDADDNLCVMDYDGYDGSLECTEEADFEWYAETGDIGIQEPDFKFYQDFQLRLTMDAHTTVKVYMQYDSDGEWRLVDTIAKKPKGCYTIPIHTPKVDHYKMKIAGKGEAKVYLVSKYQEASGEVRNIGHKL